MREESEYKEAEVSTSKNDRKPRRILHFSDGVIEEYSTDDEVENETEQTDNRVVNAGELGWLPWMYWAVTVLGSGFLGYCDSAGEKLAWWLGITSPKYYYEIQEAIRMKEEEDRRKSKEDAEMAGWRSSEQTSSIKKQIQSSK